MLLGVSPHIRRFATMLIILLTSAAIGGVLLFNDTSAAPGINQTLNFQGRLYTASGATVPDGFYNLEFKIYQDGTGTVAGNPGGTLKWTESHLNANSQGVTVRNGFMSVELGSVSAFGTNVDWNQDTLWLSMNIGNTNATCAPFASCAPDGEMVPMKRMSAVPYALNAMQLGGKTAGDFIQNGVGTQTANFNISGTGTANTLQASVFDTASAGALTVGGTNATSIDASTTGNISLQGDQVQIQDSAGATLFWSDSSDSTINTNYGTTLKLRGIADFQSGLMISGTTFYTSPLGATLTTAINVPNYNVPAYGNLMALGLSAGSDATARGILVADARTGAHQATVGVLSPDESQIFGLSWDGSNTVAALKTSSSTIALQAASHNLATATYNSADNIADMLLGTKAGIHGRLTLANYSSTNTVSLQSGVTSNSYVINLPTSIGTVGQCVSVTGITGINEQLGYADCISSADVIRNQNTSQQAAATFWISGLGRADSGMQAPSLDRADAGTLTIGGTNATGVTVGNTAGTSGVTLSSSTIGVGIATSPTTLQATAQTTANTQGSTFMVQGANGNGTGTGGTLALQGGNAGGSGQYGGNVTISGGAGSLANGLVVLSTPTFSTTTNDGSCYTTGTEVALSCTIAQSSVNNSAAILVGFTVEGQTATLPSPSITTAGRVVYVTASNLSKDFTLSVNGGGTGNQIAMRKNTSATMIWNGSAWTAAGASSSTTMQAAYDNTLQSAGGAELVVSKTSSTNGLTIRDSLTDSVDGTLLSVQTKSAAGLFQVNSNVTEYVSNAGAETSGASTSTFPGATWSAIGATTVSRNTNTSNNSIATGQGSVFVATPATAQTGVKNTLVSALGTSQNYNVSFAARLDSGTFTDMNVYYSVDGTAASVPCTSSQAIATSVWTKVNCTFTAPASGISASNAILIRQTSGTNRTFYIDNLSVTIAADYNYATDGSVTNAANFGTNWTAVSGATPVRNTSVGFDASDSAQVTTTATAGQGVRNKLSINPLPSTLYRVTAYATSSNTFNDFTVRYSRDGGSNFIGCADYNTQTVSTTLTSLTKITCYITTDGTAASDPHVYFTQNSGVARTFYVDTFSMTLNASTTPNVQIGGGVNGGPTTLFTLDRGASAPIASNNEALLGSMYYDTSLGKLQCYEADGWGSCGSSPGNVITISPEYTNAVMHGTGVGTMVSDICSDTLNINDGSSSQPTICGANETYNFYKWTSPQATTQTYSIYVTYQLPGNFKDFASGKTSLMGRTDSSNSSVSYQVYRNSPANGLTACGSSVPVSSGSVAAWQTGTATGTADPSTCGFEPGNSIVYKINITASQNANAYVGNLNFTFNNQ